MKWFKIFIGVIASIFMLNAGSTAQVTVNGGTLTLGNGSKLNCFVNVNANTNILGNGKVVMMDTALQSINMNGKQLPCLEINNASNVDVTGPIIVRDSLIFSSGHLLLNAFDLKVGAAGVITNAAAAKFVVTNSTGRLVKASLGNTSFGYPVGNSIGSFNPVTLNNSGAADSIGVRCLMNAYENGLSGNVITSDVADVSWDLTESVAGGSNLTMTASWNAADELPGFNRSNSGISNYVTAPAGSVGWDLLNNMLGAATGIGPYTYTRTDISNLGAFAIGSKKFLSPLMVSAKIFLQGNYDPVTGLMTDKLRALNLIPTTEPYTGMTSFTHLGTGGNETAPASVVHSTAAAGNNAIVDWVFVQLHDANNGNVVATKSALLQRDGDIVDTNGISPLNMYGNAPGNYYISVRHRNHLGVRSANTIALSKVAGTVYDFSTSLAQSYPGTVSNPPAALINTGVYGLYAGNVNTDLSVSMTGANASINDLQTLLNTLGNSTNIQNNVYQKGDINLDGVIRMTGLKSSQNDYLKLLDAVGPTISIITQPNF